MKCRALLSLTAVVVASVALAEGAGAAPGTGARVLHADQCYLYDEFTICESLYSVYNTTVTQSGNVSVTINTRSDNSFTGSGPLEGCNERTTGSSQQHYLFTPDGAAVGHQQHLGSTYEYSVSCSGIAYTCT